MKRQLTLKTGRFNTQIAVDCAHTADVLGALYQQAPLPKDAPIDFTIRLSRPLKKRFYKPSVVFSMAGLEPFTPLPADQAVPFFEWGANWCVSQHFHQAVVVHAAVVEKYGKAIILPGQPGAGKSTLCAALVTIGGFRLLSDELTLIDLQTGSVLPNPRPISLKNRSIPLIKSLSCEIFITETVHDTQKGSVALVRPPADAVQRWDDRAQPGLVIFPKYDENIAQDNLQPINNAYALVELANQSFNYSTLGEKAFEALAKHLSAAQCFNYKYSGNLTSAISTFDDLLRAL